MEIDVVKGKILSFEIPLLVENVKLLLEYVTDMAIYFQHNKLR